MRNITNNLIFENKLNFSNNNLTRLKSNLTPLFLIGILLTTFNESFGQLQKIVEYQSDGITIRSKYQIDTQNRKQGIGEEYFSDGKLRTKENFVNNKLDGLYEEYFPNGKLKIRCTAKSNHLQGRYGPYEEYYYSGSIKEKRTYVNPGVYRPILNGESLSYYENGNLMGRENYINGVKIGQQEERHKNGKLETTYLINSYGIHGKSISYFDDGKIKEKCEYINGKLFGEREVYKKYTRGPYTDLNIKEYYLEVKENYSNGIKVGKYESFGSDEKLRVSGNYINGKKEGIWKYFTSFDSRTQKQYEDTYLEKLANYKNDQLNGEVLEYYPNGNIKSKLNYINGNVRGIQEFYNENGTLGRRVQ